MSKQIPGDPILEVLDLNVMIRPKDGRDLNILEGVSFSVMPGERIAIVGESGSGKTITAMSIMRLIDDAVYRGEIRFRGENLLAKSEAEMRSIRGRGIAMTFQDSLSTLNPVMRIGHQIAEVMTIRGVKESEAKGAVIQMLQELGFERPEVAFDYYPHQFSGGMRQRVMIAISLIANPQILIADEPTTALDVRIQAQVIALMNRMAEQRNLTVILISHDLGVVAGVADRVLVMYAGRIVEQGSVDEIFANSRHPYTRALLDSIPTVDRDPSRPLPAITGVTPEPGQRGQGCVFQDRCAGRRERCSVETPTMTSDGPSHSYACFFPHLAEKSRS